MDHNLNENDFIYIKFIFRSSIDGRYLLGLKIVNKDKISIPVDMTDGIIRSNGYLFTNLKLLYNSYEIT